jgi:diamine N-acetyltransferase
MARKISLTEQVACVTLVTEQVGCLIRNKALIVAIGVLNMIQKLHLHVPSYEELNYKELILSQPETMNYNRGYDMNISGYDKITGCIDFPQTEWESWYNFWIGNEPNRYYAYIAQNENNAFVGEVNIHLSPKNKWYDMGIIIEGKYRGRGYAVGALNLLLKQAFCVFDANAVHNDFENDRSAAIKTHLSVGFKKYKDTNSIIELIMTKEQYNNITNYKYT